MGLAGKAALVTGGASGIGRATAERLAREGMSVCVVDRDGDGARTVAESVGGIAVIADVSDREALEDAFDGCFSAFGRLDVAHLNAGVSLDPGDPADLNLDHYRKSIAVNVDHVVFGTGAAVRLIRRAPSAQGRVVATASMAGIDPFLPNPVYTLTKHAVVGFIRAIAPGLAAEGIGAHAICPGLTDTAQITPDRRTLLVGSGMPLIDPDDVAEAVVAAITSPLESAGTCWIVNPDQSPATWDFPEVPGPHTRINTPKRR
ncbi:MAG TPA: SDR family NAD(P)-dependent oxidoreductase [Acidimicrobiales bacterium]|nr:SDR family NAD(P)-dependent oxidoreductase [Acidimicrobiales bacterium]